MTISQQFKQACDHAKSNNIGCFRFDGMLFRYSQLTGAYHAQLLA